MTHININERDDRDDDMWRWTEERLKLQVEIDVLAKRCNAFAGDMESIFTRLERNDPVEFWLRDGRGMRVSTWEPIGRGWPTPPAPTGRDGDREDG